jgi:hypothetical protein
MNLSVYNKDDSLAKMSQLQQQSHFTANKIVSRILLIIYKDICC